MVEESDVDIVSVEGCSVTWEDKTLVLTSFACFLSFIVYGATLGSLGPSIPFWAEIYGLPESDFSGTFAIRGIGYLVGTISCAVLLEGFYGISWTPSPWWKQHQLQLICYCTILIGLSTLLLNVFESFAAMHFLVFFQGCGFGGVDTIGNCIIPYLWGRRTQPWMQALHANFGIGALIGPTLVGSLGIRLCFYILGVCSLLPMVASFYASASTDGNPVDKEGGGEDKEGAQKEAETKDKRSQKLLPFSLKVMITAFFFLYVGCEGGVGSWISTYVLETGVAKNVDEAAFVAAYYWTALTAGRVLAVPLALYLKASVMLTLQLFLGVLSGALLVTIMDSSLVASIVTTVLFGYALSSVFPLAMTVVGDYGYDMDAATTAAFIVGSCLGDASIPSITGAAMGHWGPEAMTIFAFAAVVAIASIYAFVHFSIKWGWYDDYNESAEEIELQHYSEEEM